jgi:hypothetical protein
VKHPLDADARSRNSALIGNVALDDLQPGIIFMLDQVCATANHEAIEDAY